MSPNSRSRFCRSESDIVRAFFSTFSCIFFSCSAILERSCPRWENSCSSFFWARCAAGASFRIRSRLTNPMLDWARAGLTKPRAAVRVQRTREFLCVPAMEPAFKKDYTGPSEYGAKRKLDVLDTVPGLVVQRFRDADFHRSDRRVPGKAHSPRGTQLRKVELFGQAIDLSRVDESSKSHRPVRAARDREQQLRRSVDFPIASQEASVVVAWTQ